MLRYRSCWRPVRGMSGTLPLSPGLHSFHSHHHRHQSQFARASTSSSSALTAYIPFFALCFCHPDSATPFGSITLLRLIRLCSFFFGSFSTLDHVHDVSTSDHNYYFFALVQHPDFFRGPLRNQRLPHPAPRSITFIHNTPCRHATFRGQALPTTNLQGPFLHT